MNEHIFSGVGEIYAKFRPSYPTTLFDYFYSEIGITPNSTIADIGSGTGILTKELLKNNIKVFAVEPNNDMRKIAENNLKNIPGFISINGTAENTTLLENSIDYITAAQSFHWFDRVLFKKECMRILKKNGKVILIWNCRDDTSTLVKEVDLINRKYCNNFTGSSGGMRGARNDNDFDDFFTGSYETKYFRNDLVFSREHFIGLHQSASYRLEKKDPNYKQYINELNSIFDIYSKNQKLFMPNLTRVYIGNL